MPLIIRKTIGQTFLARIQSSPTRVGFRYRPTTSETGDPLPQGPSSPNNWTDLTFRQFYDRARLISFGLMSLDVRPGESVAILSNTRFEWSLCDIAILGARAVTVPIYPSNIASDVAYILENSDARVAIVEDAEQLAKLLELAERSPDPVPRLEQIVVIDPAAMRTAHAAGRDGKKPRYTILSLQALRELGRREEGRSPKLFNENLASAEPSDVISICYTTGTTGKPKGAVLTHENMMAVLEDCVERLGKRLRAEEETLLTFLPLSHVLGKLEAMSVWTLGCVQAFAESPALLPRDLLEIRPTLLFSVPLVFEKTYNLIYSTVRETSGPKKKLYAWAEKIGAHRYEALIRRDRPGIVLETQYQLARRLVFSRVSEAFGGRLRYAICGGAPLGRKVGEFFEIAGIRILEGYGLTETCGAVSLNDPDRPRYGTVGKPLRDVQIRVAEDGEILIRSRQLFRNYHKMPEETAAARPDDWFHTGDVGAIDADGFLHITDRKNDILILSSGKNVAPQKIENLAVNYPLLRECVVFGESRSFISALLILNREVVIARANEQGILFSEYAELIKNPKVIAWIEVVIGDLNQHLTNFERIRKFLILPEEFSIETGELTPSFKIRRTVIEKRYQRDLDRLYEP
jgi:long-chain acyl-CoA synthetase